MKNIYYKTINLMLSNPLLTMGLGRIIGILCVFIYVLCQGCSSNPRYVEGTTLNLGAYVPWNETMYGVELVSYVNGIKVQASSNQSFQVARTYTATNDWLWGMVKSVEGSETKVQVGSTTNFVSELK